MSSGNVRISIGSISLIHVVVTVVGQYDTWVVYIGQVPLSTVAPVCDGGIIIGVSRGYIVLELFVNA